MPPLGQMPDHEFLREVSHNRIGNNDNYQRENEPHRHRHYLNQVNNNSYSKEIHEAVRGWDYIIVDKGYAKVRNEEDDDRDQEVKVSIEGFSEGLAYTEGHTGH